jgi:hypothetical protein
MSRAGNARLSDAMVMALYRRQSQQRINRSSIPRGWY